MCVWPCAGTRTEKKTHSLSTGEGSPVFLMDERDDTPRVLNNDGERRRREIRKTGECVTRKHQKSTGSKEDVTSGVPR